jgi:putative Holliday junction resolvase
MRVMGLDIGDKTIGVAISDPMGWTAQGIKTIRRTNNKADIAEIKALIDEYKVEKIVSGLPKNMNNTLGPRSEKVMNFCSKIKDSIDIEIIYQDERLTTVAAQRILIEADVSRKKRKTVIDTIAATYILQGYLDRLANKC